MSALESVTETIYAELAHFLAKFENEPREDSFWKDRFELWWNSNPAFHEPGPRGWILRHRDRIVGFLGCIPRYFLLHGSETIAHTGTTWRVAAGHRRESLKLLSSLVSASRNTMLFNTSGTPHVSSILTRLGFSEIRVEGPIRSVYLLHPSTVMKDRFHSDVVGALARAATPIVKLVQAWRTRNIDRAALTVKKVERADEAFDELWQRLRRVYANTSVRWAEIINWYCFKQTRRQKLLFGCYDDGQLVGYAICRTYQLRSVKVLGCLDLWVDPNIQGIIPGLVNAMVAKAMEQGCDLVQVPHFSRPIAEQLWSTGLFRLDVGRFLGQYKMQHSSMERFARESCYLTHFEGDFAL